MFYLGNLFRLRHTTFGGHRRSTPPRPLRNFHPAVDQSGNGCDSMSHRLAPTPRLASCCRVPESCNWRTIRCAAQATDSDSNHEELPDGECSSHRRASRDRMADRNLVEYARPCPRAHPEANSQQIFRRPATGADQVTNRDATAQSDENVGPRASSRFLRWRPSAPTKLPELDHLPAVA